MPMENAASGWRWATGFALMGLLAIGACAKPDVGPEPVPPQNQGQATDVPAAESPSRPGGIAVASRDPSFGRFEGRLALSPANCENSKGPGVGSCTVLKTGFAFQGAVPWKVRANETTDGASIPRFAWGLVGKPFDPDHLPAAVIHDNYCEHPVRPFIETHRAFYAMLRALGVKHDKASIMYAAVMIGGPKWIELAPGEVCGGNLCIRSRMDTDPALSGLEVRNGALWQDGQAGKDRRDLFAAIADDIAGGKLQTLDGIDAQVRAALPLDRFQTLAGRAAITVDAFSAHVMAQRRGGTDG